MPPPITADINTAALPPTARDIAEIIGVEGVLKLASVANNRHVYVPKLLTADSKLVKQIGWVIAQKLHAQYAGELLHVPTCWFAALSPDGIAAMREARQQGIQPRTLARITGLSESGIRVALQRGGWARVTPIVKNTPGIGSSDGVGLRVEHGHKHSVVSEK